MTDLERTNFITGQFSLKSEPVEANALFLRTLHNASFHGARIWFDKLERSSATRELDSEMTLETFVEEMNRAWAVELQVGSPFVTEIRYCASGDLLQDGVERFAWVEAPLNSKNYSLFTRAFQESFGRKLEAK